MQSLWNNNFDHQRRAMPTKLATVLGGMFMACAIYFVLPTSAAEAVATLTVQARLGSCGLMVAPAPNVTFTLSGSGPQAGSKTTSNGAWTGTVAPSVLWQVAPSDVGWYPYLPPPVSYASVSVPDGETRTLYMVFQSDEAPYYTECPSDGGSSATNPTTLGTPITFTAKAADHAVVTAPGGGMPGPTDTILFNKFSIVGNEMITSFNYDKHPSQTGLYDAFFVFFSFHGDDSISRVTFRGHDLTHLTVSLFDGCATGSTDRQVDVWVGVNYSLRSPAVYGNLFQAWAGPENIQSIHIQMFSLINTKAAEHALWEQATYGWDPLNVSTLNTLNITQNGAYKCDTAQWISMNYPSETPPNGKKGEFFLAASSKRYTGTFPQPYASSPPTIINQEQLIEGTSAGNNSLVTGYVYGKNTLPGGSFIANPLSSTQTHMIMLRVEPVSSGAGLGDKYYLLICKNGNNPTPGVSAPPECNGGSGNRWARSAVTNPNAQATAIYANTTFVAESNPWFAFICDHRGSGATCSPAYQGPPPGQGGSNNDSPFYVNRPPVFTDINDNPDPQFLGLPVTFAPTASDPDVSGAPHTPDTVKLLVCGGTSGVTSSGCGSQTQFCVDNDIATPPTCTYLVQPADLGQTITYYGFVFDNHGVAATTNPISKTFSATNRAPTFTVEPSDNSSSQSTPTNEDAQTTFTARGNDPDGDSYYIIFCDGGATAGNNGPPSCNNGPSARWHLSDERTNASPSVVLQRTALFDDDEVNDWLAYVCDKRSNGALCSAGNPGASSPTPFYVNHRPSFSLTPSGPPYTVDSDVTFSATSDDIDVGDEVTFYLCRGSGASATGCDDPPEELCPPVTQPSNPSCNYTIQVSDTTIDYCGYILDNHNLESDPAEICSSLSTNTAPTVTVTKHLPATVVQGRDYTVRWLGDDEEGDDMTCLAEFKFDTPDNGATISIVQGTVSQDTECELTFRANSLGRYRLNVWVGDGSLESEKLETPMGRDSRVLPSWIEVKP